MHPSHAWITPDHKAAALKGVGCCGHARSAHECQAHAAVRCTRAGARSLCSRRSGPVCGKRTCSCIMKRHRDAPHNTNLTFTLAPSAPPHPLCSWHQAIAHAKRCTTRRKPGAAWWTATRSKGTRLIITQGSVLTRRHACTCGSHAEQAQACRIACAAAAQWRRHPCQSNTSRGAGGGGTLKRTSVASSEVLALLPTACMPRRRVAAAMAVGARAAIPCSQMRRRVSA